MTTVFQRIKQLMEDIEKTSTKFIPVLSYYILCISICSNSKCDINDLVISELLTNAENQPLAIYSANKELLLIMPNREENERHFLEGNQQKICSWYCNKLNEYNISAYVSITEFISQTSLITYVGYKITSQSFNLLKSLVSSHLEMKEEDVEILPSSDIIDELLEHNVYWDDISEHNRYGTLYKLDDTQDEIVIVTKSEEYDARKHEEYCNFIFGV